jgi:hypothetical protein
MRSLVISATSAALIVATNTASLAAVKEVPYTAVKVELAEAYTPNAAFEKMRNAFADAVAKKDAQALFSLVGPTFVWMSGAQGGLGDQFDSGRDALHNFKVVFGFREFGKDTDGGVADGPFWDTLAAFAAVKVYYAAAGSLVCGPPAATIVDEDVFERAKQTIGADDSVGWYFTVADTPATATPAGTGAPVGRVKQVALPVMDVYPPAQGQSVPPVTHLQVLLPLGKSGWIPVSAVVPLVTDRLCYALTSNGEWKISGFDQAEE